MTGHDHDHHHDHDHSELSETELRVRALETILTEKGYVDPAALDLLIETYETKVGPRNGARVVAKAWADPAYRARLLKDATPAIVRARLCRPAGRAHRGGREHARLCTTWSCARCAPVIRGRCWGCRRSGTSPRPTARSAVKDPRGVLADFGVELPEGTGIRVWDSTAEIRYLVLPMRPDGTDGWSEERLADLVTRDSMIGTGLPKQPHEVA